MADTLLSFGLIDDAGKTKRVPVFLPSTMTLAQIQGWSDLYAPLLDTVVDGKLTLPEVTFTLTLPSGLKSSPVADSTVRRGADLSFANVSRNKWGLYVPSWSLTYISSGDIDVSTTNPAAFVDAYVSGLTFSSTVYQPLNGYGDDLTSLSKSKEAFRK